MTETCWTYVMDEASLPEGAIAPVYPKGVNLLLAKVLGKVYALDGKCSHMGCPLFTGHLSGLILTCPCHDWRFDITNGRFIDAPELGLRVFPTKAEDGKLFVNMTSTEAPS